MNNDVVVMLIESELMVGKEQIHTALCEAGFSVKVVKMAAAEKAIASENPALMIVNLTETDQANLDDCIRLVQACQAPLIAIGPGGMDTFRTAVLEAAADDYLIRPVNPQELTVRARNILPRANPTFHSSPPGSTPGDTAVPTEPAAAEPEPTGKKNNWLSRIFKHSQE